MTSLYQQIEKIAAKTTELPPVYWVEERPRCYKCRDSEVQLQGDYCEFCTTEQTQGYEALTMTGRCANGAQRDSGILYHAVMIGQYKAVCGATHGKRSRWSEYHGDKVTCKRCADKIAKGTR
jgi:hypothetical protein